MKHLMLYSILLFVIFLEFIIQQIIPVLLLRLDIIVILIAFFRFGVQPYKILLIFIGLMRDIIFMLPIGSTPIIYLATALSFKYYNLEGNLPRKILLLVIILIFSYFEQWSLMSIFARKLLPVLNFLVSTFIIMPLYVIVCYFYHKYHDKNINNI